MLGFDSDSGTTRRLWGDKGLQRGDYQPDQNGAQSCIRADIYISVGRFVIRRRKDINADVLDDLVSQSPEP